MRSTVLLVIKSSPYGSDVVYAGLRLALGLTEHAEVRIFLVSDAVGTALEGQSHPSEDWNLDRRLRDLIEKGVEVSACGLCLEVRGMHCSRLISGVAVGTMQELAIWTLESDKILTF